MAKAIHSMIRVLDVEKSIEFYGKAFGLAVADRYDFDKFALVYLRNDENDFEVELTLNKGRSEPYGRGDGYGHLAVCVEIARPNARVWPASDSTRGTLRNSTATAR